MKPTKQMKRILAAVLAAMLLCTMSACGGTKADSGTNAAGSVSAEANPGTDAAESASPEASFAAPADEAGPVQKPTEDRSGAAIAVPDEVGRVAVLAPSIAETLINLGCAETIVAVDTNTQGYGYEQLAAELPAFDMMAPDTEKLAALKPDVVFISGVTDIGGVDLYADLKGLGVCVINIPSSDSIQGVKDDIAFIAACMGKTSEGERIIADMTAELDRIAAVGATITERKKVYFEIAAAPYAYSFGSGTYLNEAIELIGAENVLAGQEGWLSVDMESIVSLNPDVIMTSVNYIEDPVGEILSRDGWGGVNAVKNGEVYYVDNRSSSLPNENIVKAIKEMAAAIYPEAYEE